MNETTRQCPRFMLVLRVAIFACCVLTAWQKAAAQEPLAQRLKLSVYTEQKGEEVRGFAIAGLTEAELAAAKDSQLSTAQFQELASIAVKSAEGSNRNRALAGNYEIQRDRILFLPRYSPMAGVSYELHFDEARLPESMRAADATIVMRSVKIPRAEAAPANVAQVYPTGDELPENTLKFYVHFSAPMTVGNSYQHVRLFDTSGVQPREVELPFLTLEQELWNHDGTRLTLLFDPGRIKRGLKPREEVGPALEDGKSYELVISSAWEDAHGNPMDAEFKKQFRVFAPDDRQPDPAKWRFDLPQAGTKDPFEVTFAEPLDHAMLERVLSIQQINAEKEQTTLLVGEIHIEAGESNWRFVPESPWEAGDYNLVIEATLEDRAGNSIGRPFEVDIFNQVDRGVARKFVRREFTIAD